MRLEMRRVVIRVFAISAVGLLSFLPSASAQAAPLGPSGIAPVTAHLIATGAKTLLTTDHAMVRVGFRTYNVSSSQGWA